VTAQRPMEQTSVEQTIIDALRDMPAKQRDAVLQIVRLLARELKDAARTDGLPHYSVERHRVVRQLTGTVKGNLAAAISAERDERG
jgi:hypothetical protein